MTNISDYLLDEAVVFVAGENYDIIWNTSKPGLAYIDCGGIRYFDHANGNIKSEETVHRITIPMSVLDKACQYTIFFRESIDRKAYFPVTGELCSKTYSFRPVQKGKDYRFYFISDTHNEYKTPIMAASKYENDLDFLVLGGDVPNDCENFDQGLRTIFRISGTVTKGEIPVISARGNHDTRGHIAPTYHRYSPLVNGEMYFTFVLGDIFGIILDCGEDKPDDHPEYGFVNCFEMYRRGVTEFLRQVAEKQEYKNHKHTIVICHERTDAKNHGHFIGEYEKWVKYINKISPDFMLCGHEHRCKIFDKGRPHFDTETVHEFTTVVGSQVRGNRRTTLADLPEGFTGTYGVIKENELEVYFTNDKHEIEETHTVKFN